MCGDLIHFNDESADQELPRGYLKPQALELLNAPSSYDTCFLALGNHDLMDPSDGLAKWSTELQKYPRIVTGDNSKVVDGVQFIVMNNQWLQADGTYDYIWEKGTPVAGFDEQQWSWLAESLAAESDLPVVLCLHYPSFLPPDSFAEVKSSPEHDGYVDRLTKTLDSSGRKTLILTGHVHMTKRVKLGQSTLISTAAFSEWPLQTRLITVKEDKFHIEVFDLIDDEEINGTERVVTI